MKKSTLAFVLFYLLFEASSFAQMLNNYNYVSIPNRFGFQKEENSYEINELTKFLFNKYNFEAYLENEKLLQELPNCEVLKASMEKKGGFINTKIKVILKDCKGQIVYTSPEGLSIKKDYKQAYHEAIRNALDHSLIKNHKYLPKKNTPNKPKKDVLNKPKPVKVITGVPEIKQPQKKPTKKGTPQLLFELRGKQYAFQKNEKGFLIFGNGQLVGKAILQSNKVDYKIDGGNLSGEGSFDDYGNFVLRRINPANNKSITDILARIN